MIGGRCKGREALSRAALIGRAHARVGAPRGLKETLSLDRCAAPRAPEAAPEEHMTPQVHDERPSRAGGRGGGGTPGTIPNPKAKPASAESTAGATPREGRAPPAREGRLREGPLPSGRGPLLRMRSLRVCRHHPDGGGIPRTSASGHTTMNACRWLEGMSPLGAYGTTPKTREWFETAPS